MRSGSVCVKHMVGGVCGSMPLVDGDGCGEDVVWREMFQLGVAFQSDCREIGISV